MQRRVMGLQKVLLATQTLELAPATTAGITIGPKIAQPYPAIIRTVRLGTKLRRGVHLARPSLGGRPPHGRNTQGWKARLWGLLTGGTAGFVGEARKWLRVSGALVDRCGGLACCQAGRGSVSCPPFIQDDAQPQEDYQRLCRNFARDGDSAKLLH